MTPLAQFMELNRNIILFLYGLVFFSLGLTLAMQSRSHSRLELARSLKWLAAFGLIHGSYEWGELIIPLQSPNLSVASLFFWKAAQLLALAASFAVLFQFGISLLALTGKWRWLHILPTALFLLWLAVVYGVLLPVMPDTDTWRNTGNALTRYFISLPAGLLASFGLRRYAQQRIVMFNAPHILRTLQTASLALFLYALLSGLIAPPAPFFPANWLNTISFSQVTQVPVRIFRSVIGLLLTISMIRALEIFDLEYLHQIEAMERKQILGVERERLGRELHDGAMQAVYTAGLLVESAVSLAAPGSPLAERLQSAIGALDGAVQDMRRSLNELTTTAENQSLVEALSQLVQDPRLAEGVRIQLALNLPIERSLSPSATAHVLAIVREALVNIIRHANASLAKISLEDNGQQAHLSICDNGRGMSPDTLPGYGLRNMSDRARLLGGKLTISGQPGKGVALQLDFPWEEKA